MSKDAEATGICAHCGAEGVAGGRCTDHACALKTRHLIPREHAASGVEPDPMIGRMIDEHLLVRLIGQGGVGKVYLAIQLPVGLRTAVKLLDLPNMDAAKAEVALRNVEREARALAALSHPSIVRLYRYGIFGDQPYLVMEYLESARGLDQEMKDRWRRKDWFPRETARAILAQLLDGLEAAHTRDIIHRDIKPGNIMLQEVEGNPLLVRLLDFGLAKDLSQGSLTETVIGTPDYMAPEQIRQLLIGPPTDLYALSCLAVELLTGKRPFPSGDVQAVIAAKLDTGFDPTAPLESIQAPEAVRGFFRKALAVRSRDRFPNVTEFRRGLLPAIDLLGHPTPRITSEGTWTDAPDAARRGGLMRWLDHDRRRIDSARSRVGRKKDGPS
jgi:serine/threonine protein kinase